jgi:Mg/Co/Ni transporter MgtE
MVWVVKAELKDIYNVYVEFNDGVSGIINFKEKLENDHRQIIKELLDKNKFKTVKVDLDTLCWDNGVDFGGEYLYDIITSENKRVA